VLKLWTACLRRAAMPYLEPRANIAACAESGVVSSRRRGEGEDRDTGVMGDAGDSTLRGVEEVGVLAEGDAASVLRRVVSEEGVRGRTIVTNGDTSSVLRRIVSGSGVRDRTIVTNGDTSSVLRCIMLGGGVEDRNTLAKTDV
jgi:hypothetical protein